MRLRVLFHMLLSMFFWLMWIDVVYLHKIPYKAKAQCSSLDDLAAKEAWIGEAWHQGDKIYCLFSKNKADYDVASVCAYPHKERYIYEFAIQLISGSGNLYNCAEDSEEVTSHFTISSRHMSLGYLADRFCLPVYKEDSNLDFTFVLEMTSHAEILPCPGDTVHRVAGWYTKEGLNLANLLLLAEDLRLDIIESSSKEQSGKMLDAIMSNQDKIKMVEQVSEQIFQTVRHLDSGDMQKYISQTWEMLLDLRNRMMALEHNVSDIITGKTDYQPNIDAIKRVNEDGFGYLQTFFSPPQNSKLLGWNPFSNIWSGLKTIVNDILHPLDTMKGLINEIKDFLLGLPDKVVNALKALLKLDWEIQKWFLGKLLEVFEAALTEILLTPELRLALAALVIYLSVSMTGINDYCCIGIAAVSYLLFLKL